VTDTTKPPVWVLSYTHRHGDDISVHETEVAAKIAACAIIIEWLYEIEEELDQEKLCKLVSEGMYDEAIKTWEEIQSCASWERETIEINQREIATLGQAIQGLQQVLEDR